MRITPRGAASAVAAVLGIVSAAVLAWSVSRLVAERIGLSSAPPSVVQGLVPRPPGRGAPLTPRTEDPSTTATGSGSATGTGTGTGAAAGAAPGPSAPGPAGGTAGTAGAAGTGGTGGTAGTAGTAGSAGT
ncbi:MAG TPA: hypothetical protein VFN87_21880, partial [Solirubrobacteraceae bacterium]|nr:hypothetical protein [Solirubrobacteraceae bacterium]